ncbi:glycoside hydrolase family 32 protein [Runella sp.]|uniref:glycoside hydrolase family 32 protein n=1 Tax=Runella sp. TaxID=1960881 RepID=UPI003D12DE98
MKKTALFWFFIIRSLIGFSQSVPQDYRPQFHYTAPKNWVNDPNGMVYLDGEYHLFYQYNPFGNVWGHMSWGHAVSKDLQHWETLPPALPEFDNPDGTQTMIFSGCAVIDSMNTSGFFEKGFTKGMVAIFTSHIEGKAQHQSIAYSIDKGRTWKRYDKNPVLDLGMKDFRDPSVIWYPEKQAWIMTVVKPLEYMAQFYESKDLKKWTLLSEFGKQGDMTKIWECPSLTKIPIEGTKEFKWVLMVSSGHRQKNYLAMQYFVGDFDGKTFTSQKQNEILYVDEGKDFYAAIPFNNLPKSHTKPIMIGWINDWEYAREIPTGDTWRGGFSVPRELSLKKTANGLRLVQHPVMALKKLAFSVKNKVINKAYEVPFKGEVFDLALEIQPQQAKAVTLNIFQSKDEATVIRYDVFTQELSLDRTHSGQVNFHPRFSSIERVKVPLKDGKLSLRLLADKSIVELFAQDGEQVLTDWVFPTKHEGGITITSEGGNVKLNNLSIHTLPQ